MAKKRPRRADRPAPQPRPGEIAQAQGRTLNSYRLGALPILDSILRRLRLAEFLRDRLPRGGSPHQDPHRHRTALADQEPAGLPRAALRRRRMGRAVRPGGWASPPTSWSTSTTIAWAVASIGSSTATSPRSRSANRWCGARSRSGRSTIRPMKTASWWIATACASRPCSATRDTG